DGLIGDNSSNVIGEDIDEDLRIFERVINNELSSETNTTVKAPGEVNRLTTSVLYDGNLSAERSDKILSIVAAATGYDNDRGDFINIEDLQFDTSYEDELQEELDRIREEEKKSGGILNKYRNHIILGLLSIFAT